MPAQTLPALLVTTACVCRASSRHSRCTTEDLRLADQAERGIGVYLHGHCGFPSIFSPAFSYFPLLFPAKFKAGEN
jgi:hypothetical protein